METQNLYLKSVTQQWDAYESETETHAGESLTEAESQCPGFTALANSWTWWVCFQEEHNSSSPQGASTGLSADFQSVCLGFSSPDFTVKPCIMKSVLIVLQNYWQSLVSVSLWEFFSDFLSYLLWRLYDVEISTFHTLVANIITGSEISVHLYGNTWSLYLSPVS